MTQPSRDSPPAVPAWKPLDPYQRRVLGVLIEKAKTTPGAYPMTVNAIVTGCNQKNNREPLMTLEAFDVEKALEELRALGAVSEIDWLGRVAKYKHQGYEWLGVSKLEIAVMGELLLRGPQALGELRGRAARMEPITDLAALKPIVEALRERGLMIELTAPGRGQIVSHNLHSTSELVDLKARYAGHVPHAAPSSGDDPAPRHSSAPSPSRAGQLAVPPQAAAESATTGVPPEIFAALSLEVATLRAEVIQLRETVSALEAKLTAALG